MTSIPDKKAADPALQTNLDGDNGMVFAKPGPGKSFSFEFDRLDSYNQLVMAKSGSGMSFALNEMNKQYHDGKAGELDAGASSGDFLRQAAFARESMVDAAPKNAVVSALLPLRG